MAVDDAVLVMWVVYDHPADYPHGYLARQWRVEPGQPQPQPQGDLRCGASLEAVRAQLPPGLYCLERHPEDDPVIVETWL